MLVSVLSNLAFAAVAAAQSTLSVATPPSVAQCIPIQLTWSGGKAPYWVDVIPYQQTSAAPLATLLDKTNDVSYTWHPALAPGTNVNIRVRDSDGNLQYSSEITIQNGDDSCMNSTSSASGSNTTEGTGQTGTDAGTGAAAVPTGGSTASGAASNTGASTETTTGGAAANTGASSETTTGGAASTTSGAETSKAETNTATNTASGTGAPAATKSNATGLKAASVLAVTMVAALALVAF